MDMKLVTTIDSLSKELDWLNALIEYRFQLYFKHEGDLQKPALPQLINPDCIYSEYVNSLNLSATHRVLIILALAPHLRPSVFDLLFTKNKITDRVYAEFGGIKGEKYAGFIPTAETAAFILAGEDLAERIHLAKAVADDSVLIKENILQLGEVAQIEPVWAGELSVTDEFRVAVTEGKPFKPRYSTRFPAEQVTTNLAWEDAIFEDSIVNEIRLIELWLKNEKQIMEEWALSKYLKRGYRALFFGPPGTGKSMAASLLGKSTNREVYRVDLSNVVSKYIGETEKNLARLFNIAENKAWILFFDEADALFSKRSNTSSSNDVFANQQVAYLLQRIEDFNGLTILASNFKDNMDEAFLRRFQSLVYFKKPGVGQRLQLWQNYFKSFELVDVNFHKIAEDYEMTGGSIINVLRFCAQIASRNGHQKLTGADLQRAIQRELLKD